MRRAGIVSFAAIVCVGLVALAAVGARDQRDLAFTIGVVPSIVAAELRPGESVCQTPIAVPEAFEQVRLRVGRAGSSGQALAVDVRSTDFKRRLADGRVRGGWAGIADRDVVVGEVAAGQRVTVCVRNAGRRATAVYGNAAVAAPINGAYLRGEVLQTDLTLVFLRGDSKTMLSALPDIFERAAVFRPGWVEPWLFWLLAAGVLLGAPVLLAAALAATGNSTASEARAAPAPERASAP